MKDYSLLISGLEYKIRQLVEKNNSYIAEIAERQELMDSLETENRLLKQQLDEISYKKQVLELSGHVESSRDSHKLKLKINQYIREIDKCIAFLNNG